MRLRGASIILGIVLACGAFRGEAEPYLAVREGKKCIVCHVNPTGGGKRTEYGNVFAQTRLPARYVRVVPSPPTTAQAAGDEEADEEYEEDGEENGQAGGAFDAMIASNGALLDAPAADPTRSPFWNGALSEHLALGGDLRTVFNTTLIPNEDDNLSFRFTEALLYMEWTFIPRRLTIYLDEKVAPAGASNREGYVLYWTPDARSYVKAGRMFLPYGLRLEDDTAFIRRVPGINYNTPDTGVEWGYQPGPWSFHLAITNGTAGGGEVDRGKQYSLMAAYVRPGWRAGASFNFNDAGADERTMANVFGGLQTGRVTWLGEIDYIRDMSRNGREMVVGLIEANLFLRKGHNLKWTYEYFEPDLEVSNDQQDRISLVYEVFPMQFGQYRLGYRLADGIPQNNAQNSTEVFLELHVLF